MKVILILVVPMLLLLNSCAKKEMKVEDKPEWVISESKMVDILVDLRIADAAIYTDNRAIPRSKVKDFEFIFKKHHINDKLFRDSHEYYSEHPEVLENIYERVMDKLSEMVANNAQGQ